MRMASRGPKIVCESCGQDVRLFSLVENDGIVIGCGCNDVRHSVDAMAYELGVTDLNDDWVPKTRRSDQVNVDENQKSLTGGDQR